ncbi:MAG: Ppx/GppA family phosphatase [Acidimicrobiia bacterium]|nr:Ppx/GppA family phosphatase [Acidimicrobiia bacterium]
MADGEGEVVAAIDVGTNSVHLLVARVVAGGFEPLAREKEVVRLGSGSGDMKVLRPDAVDRGIAALRRFRQIAAISGARIVAVATSAVREAENRDTFLERARDEAGVEVEPISGLEEARLVYLGALAALPVFDQQGLFVDIGGGSTELVIGRAGEVLEASSLKLGAIRLTSRFFADEPITKRAVEDCRQYVASTLSAPARRLRRHGFEVAVGSSGTIRNLAEMVEARRRPGSTTTARGLSFSREELGDTVKELVRAKRGKASAKLAGLDPARADIILGGALLLEQVFAALRVDAMVVSDYALREGVLLDALRRGSGRPSHHLQDVRERSVRHLAGLCPDELAHGEQVARLALQLHDGCADIGLLDGAGREYLEAGALLANVGLVISHAGHHLHSYYVIRNSERLTGFTDHEVELIAQIARYHRKSDPKPSHVAFDHLREDDQRTVRTLAGILRVAAALDRTYAGVVRSLSCARGDDGLVVRVDAGGADIALEHYTTEARKGLLEQSLGAEVRIEVVS